MEGKKKSTRGSNSLKILLWDEILKYFTLPEGVEPAIMKRWTLTRMATQFQKFKQQLDKIISRRIELLIGLNIPS
jgi:hypothetical protein